MGVRISTILTCHNRPINGQRVRKKPAPKRFNGGNRQHMAGIDERLEIKPRIRKVDWRRVVTMLDEMPAETEAFIGVLDQSVRTHLRKGRYSYIDPSKYVIWTESVQGSRTQARLYMKRKE